MENEDTNQAALDALLTRIAHGEEINKADSGKPAVDNGETSSDAVSSIEIDQGELDALLQTAPQVITAPQIPDQGVGDGFSGQDANVAELLVPADSLTIPQEELDRLLGISANPPSNENAPQSGDKYKMGKESPNDKTSSENESLEMTQEQLDALLAGAGDDEIFDDSPQSVLAAVAAKTPPPAGLDSDIDQSELDALMAAMGDDEIFADTPDLIQAAAANKSAAKADEGSDIDQAELDALMAAMGDDELFSDDGPVAPPKKSAAPANESHSAAKAEKPLSQEEIDAMLAALGGN